MPGAATGGWNGWTQHESHPPLRRPLGCTASHRGSGLRARLGVLGHLADIQGCCGVEVMDLNDLLKMASYGPWVCLAGSLVMLAVVRLRERR